MTENTSGRSEDSITTDYNHEIQTEDCSSNNRAKGICRYCEYPTSEECAGCGEFFCEDHRYIKCFYCSRYCCTSCGIRYCGMCYGGPICVGCFKYIENIKYKETALECVKKDGHWLQHLSEIFRNDIDIINEAIKNTQCAFSLTSKQDYSTISRLFLTIYETHPDNRPYLRKKHIKTISTIKIFGLYWYISDLFGDEAIDNIKKKMLPYLQARVGVDTDFLGFVQFDMVLCFDYNEHKKTKLLLNLCY